jgi:hypothetical protein
MGAGTITGAQLASGMTAKAATSEANRGRHRRGKGDLQQGKEREMRT